MAKAKELTQVEKQFYEQYDIYEWLYMQLHPDRVHPYLQSGYFEPKEITEKEVEFLLKENQRMTILCNGNVTMPKENYILAFEKGVAEAKQLSNPAEFTPIVNIRKSGMTVTFALFKDRPNGFSDMPKSQRIAVAYIAGEVWKDEIELTDVEAEKLWEAYTEKYNNLQAEIEVKKQKIKSNGDKLIFNYINPPVG